MTDVYSPLCVAVSGGYISTSYTLTEEFEWIYMYISQWGRSMKHLKMFKEFLDEVENHCNKKIKNLWFDHKGRYLSYKF